MPTWNRSEKTTTTIIYTVPAPWPHGGNWAEVASALEAAQSEAMREHGGNPLSDDTIWVIPEDDKIVIRFQKKEAARPEAWGAADHR